MNPDKVSNLENKLHDAMNDIENAISDARYLLVELYDIDEIRWDYVFGEFSILETQFDELNDKLLEVIGE